MNIPQKKKENKNKFRDLNKNNYKKHYKMRILRQNIKIFLTKNITKKSKIQLIKYNLKFNNKNKVC